MRELMGHLMTDESGITVIDMEAGLEHLRRGTTRYVDAMLVVAEPYYKSLETAGRTVELARELGVERVYAVANKVRDERDAEAVRDYFGRRGVPLLSIIPFDETIVEADRRGTAPIDVNAESALVRAVTGVGQDLLQASKQA